MNDLTLYNQNRHDLRPADLVLFWGTEPISYAIKLFAGGPTHSAIVRQPAIGGHDVRIIESTIEGSKNGVQTNFLGQTLANYGAGAQAAALLLKDEVRARIDWEAFYAFCGASEDRVKYDVGGLFEFILREVPIIGTRVGQEEKQNAMVCSAWAAALWSKCGLISHINWSKMRPQDLEELALYRLWVPLLGNPPISVRYNTI